MSNDPNDDKEYWLERIKRYYEEEAGDLRHIQYKSEQELRRIARWIADRIGEVYERVLEALRRLGGRF